MQNILAIDIGNTNIVFGVIPKKINLSEIDDKIVSFRLDKDHKNVDEYFQEINNHFEENNIQIDAIEHVIIASVIPEKNDVFKEIINKYLKKEPLFLENKHINIPVLYNPPEDVGIDRLVNSYVGRMLYGQPLIIIDFGTAVTCDVINSKGEYVGGMIFPGIDMSLNALHKNTAKLPKVDINIPNIGIGKDTTTSIQTGVYFGCIGAIKQFCELVVENLNQNSIKRVITGGYAHLFVDSRLEFDCIDKNLTLRGLKVLADEIFR